MAEEDELGNFFAEIEEIQSAPAVATENEHSDPVIGPSIPSKNENGGQQPFSQPVSIVYSNVPFLREDAVTASHPVYTYDQPEYFQQTADSDYSRYYFDDSASSKLSSMTSSIGTNPRPQQPPPPPLPIVPRSDKTFVRKAAEEVWVDESLQEWPENDFRIFVGDLGKEVTTDTLTRHFQQYKSFAKAKALRGKDGKSKGYGFVSFLEPGDCIKAMKEENGKYLGSRYARVDIVCEL